MAGLGCPWMLWSIQKLCLPAACEYMPAAMLVTVMCTNTKPFKIIHFELWTKHWCSSMGCSVQEKVDFANKFTFLCDFWKWKGENRTREFCNSKWNKASAIGMLSSALQPFIFITMSLFRKSMTLIQSQHHLETS